MVYKKVIANLYKKVYSRHMGTPHLDFQTTFQPRGMKCYVYAIFLNWSIDPCYLYTSAVAFTFEGLVLTNYTKTVISLILKHYFYYLDYKAVALHTNRQNISSIWAQILKAETAKSVTWTSVILINTCLHSFWQNCPWLE